MSGEQSIWVRDEWLQKARIKSRVGHYFGFESTDKGIRSTYGIKASVEHGKTLDKRKIF